MFSYVRLMKITKWDVDSCQFVLLDSSLVAASTMLFQLMLDESISVRTEAIKSFSVIFKNKSKVEQLKVFSHIKNIIKNFRRPEIVSTLFRSHA